MAKKSDKYEKAADLFKNWILNSHIDNILKKSRRKSSYNINPFLIDYLPRFLNGSGLKADKAKVLMYPRILGTGINTSFGTFMQNKICVELLGAKTSPAEGIDIEFQDKVDKKHKYCQLKAGPNTINSSTVKTIKGHFTKIINKLNADGKPTLKQDFIVGVTYGEKSELSSHYKLIQKVHKYPVIVGSDFWHRVSGSKVFYKKLIKTFNEVSIKVDHSKDVQAALKKLESVI